MSRILFDVSFSRTQERANGIVRTVSRLSQSLETQLPKDSKLFQVTYHSTGLRHRYSDISSQSVLREPEKKSNFYLNLFSKYFHVLASRVSSLLPLFLRHLAWSRYNRFIYNQYSKNDAPLKLEKGDILFLCDGSWNYPIWEVAVDFRNAGGKVILVVYDIMPIRKPEFCSSTFSWAFRNWLINMLKCSDAVICISKTTEADLCNWAKSENIKLPPTESFRLGSDLRPELAVETVRQHIKKFTSSNTPYFSSIGIFEPKKNYDFQLQTFESLWAMGHDIRLLIAGSPTVLCAPLIQRLIKHPEQGKRLLTVFDATDQEISHIYATSKALLLTSLFEGFGLPLVEARTHGCIVIASDLPVFIELADKGVFIFKQNSSEEFQKIILEQVNKKAGKKIEPMRSFSWDESAVQLIGVSRLLLKSNELGD